MKIINVVGARPNFVKIAPLIEEMKKYPEIEPILVHTGQHYNYKMSKLFFKDLGIPEPDIYLGVGSGSHAEQTAKIMLEFEKVLLKEKPDLVVVVGDVNSTVACALVASKIEYPINQLSNHQYPYGHKLTNRQLSRRRPLVAHVEAGLRSFDRTMPEEINRILTDAISDYLFVDEKSGEINLLNEGVTKEKIHFSGNIMIDTLLKSQAASHKSQVLKKLGLEPKKYALLTLHRPSNVDDKETFERILEALGEVCKHIPIVYPAHPRARKKIEEFGFAEKFEFLKVTKSQVTSHTLTGTGKSQVTDCQSTLHCPQSTHNSFQLIEPLGYIDFLKLMSNAKFALTDSGGIQEETTVLGIPCLTLRKNTERPVTVEQGTNVVLGTGKERIIEESLNLLDGETISSNIPKLWDGKAAQRIVNVLLCDLK